MCNEITMRVKKAETRKRQNLGEYGVGRGGQNRQIKTLGARRVRLGSIKMEKEEGIKT